MSTPVIFIHKGDHYYLNYSLNQVKITNPNNPIYLITDTITNRYPFVNYIDINKYFNGANEFAKVYKHMSTNGFDNELFCFQRWYILKEFCNEKKLTDFLYLDSDLLIYCNVDAVFGQLKEYDFTISKKLSPHCCYFPSLEKLNKFCEFIPKLYTDSNYINRFLTKHKHHLDNNLPGGVCDMTAFNEYQKEPAIKVKDLSIIEGDEVFDDNINDADGFLAENGIKKLSLEQGFYYGTLKENNKKVKFNTLHFQGPAKKYIAKYYFGKSIKKIEMKLMLDEVLNSNQFFYKVARKLGYKFY